MMKIDRGAVFGFTLGFSYYLMVMTMALGWPWQWFVDGKGWIVAIGLLPGILGAIAMSER